MQKNYDQWIKAQIDEVKHWYGHNPSDNAEHMLVASELYGQIVGYAKFLGLENDYLINNSHDASYHGTDYYKKPRYDLQGKSVVDLGGGPTSLLLRCRNFSKAIVVDPLPMTDTVKKRYKEHGIELISLPAEEFMYPQKFDEVWNYNCLHHVMDPDQILQNAKQNCKTLRIYEILNTRIDSMHLYSFNADYFHRMLGPGGNVKNMNNELKPSPDGDAYYGIFHFE